MLIERTSGRVRGELVLIINGYTEPQEERPEALNELIIWYRDKGKTSLKDAVRLISRDLDIPRSKVYRQALAVWKDE